MSSHLQNGHSDGATVIVRTMDEYLAHKHGSSHASSALAALYRDRYGDDCSALTCDSSADVVLIVLNAPTISVALCESHAVQLRNENADLVGHLPTLTPETNALLPRDDQAGSPNAHLAPTPEPLDGVKLMNALSGKSGKSELTDAEMDDWMKDTRKVREASRPNTDCPRTPEHGDADA